MEADLAFNALEGDLAFNAFEEEDTFDTAEEDAAFAPLLGEVDQVILVVAIVVTVFLWMFSAYSLENL